MPPARSEARAAGTYAIAAGKSGRRREAAAGAATAVTAPAAEVAGEAVTAPQVPGLYGIIRAGRLKAAFAIESIREVVPHPPELLAWPHARPELRGAFDLRGSVVPVLDLGALLQLEGGVPEALAQDSESQDSEAQDSEAPGEGAQAEQGPPVILIVRHDGHVFGLVISEICGVVRLDADSITPLRRVGSVQAVTTPAAFVTALGSGVIVDAAALAALEGMPSARSSMQAAADSLAKGQPQLLVSIGEHGFAFAAEVIDATVPERPILPCAVQDPVWIGMLQHKGRRIPVVDTLRLFGLGQAQPCGMAPCLVVRVGVEERLMALRIDAVHDMIQLRTSEILPLQSGALAHGDLFAGVHEFGGVLRLVVDAAALRQWPGLLALAGLEEAGETDAAEAAGIARQGAPASGGYAASRPFLIVRLGSARHALPLEQIEEILPHSARRIALAGQGLRQALITHRGHAIPLVSLAGLIGHGRSAAGSGFSVISSDGDRRMGFEVDELISVERAPVQMLQQKQGAGSAGLLARTISRGEHVYTVIDLGTLIRQQTAAGDPRKPR